MWKELQYDERSTPTERNLLKALKRGQQGGKCARCGDDLPPAYTELDRKNAWIHRGEH
jgi:hypothetical protein